MLEIRDAVNCAPRRKNNVAWLYCFTLLTQRRGAATRYDIEKLVALIVNVEIRCPAPLEGLLH